MKNEKTKTTPRVSKHIFEVKPNSTNTAIKFFNPFHDQVQKLNYFQPYDNSISDKQDIKNSLPNIKKISETSVLREEDVKTMQKFSKFEFPKLFAAQNKVGKKHSQSLQKMEHISFENNLNNKRKFYEDMIKEKREAKNDFVLEINRLIIERDDLEAEIEFLNNLDRFASVEEQIRMRGLNSELQKTRSIDEEHFLLLKKLKYAHEKRSSELEKRINEIKLNQEILHENREKLKKIEEELNEYKTELEKVRDALILHYHRILSEGKDTRQEGLTWVIREILLLGSNVILSYLPNFLDEECISYLFKFANFQIEIFKIQEEKIKIKRQLKQKYEEKLLKKIKHRSTFRTALLPNNYYPKSRDNSPQKKKNIIEKYQEECSIFQIDTIFTMKTIDKFIGNKSVLDIDIIKIIDKIEEYENQEKNLREASEHLKSSQMNRLFKEFTLNDYEKRFITNKNAVVSALIGEDQMHHELLRQAREEKIFYDNIKKCRNFNFLDNGKVSRDKYYADVDNLLSKRA